MYFKYALIARETKYISYMHGNINTNIYISNNDCVVQDVSKLNIACMNSHSSYCNVYEMNVWNKCNEKCSEVEKLCKG